MALASLVFSAGAFSIALVALVLAVALLVPWHIGDLPWLAHRFFWLEAGNTLAFTLLHLTWRSWLSVRNLLHCAGLGALGGLLAFLLMTLLHSDLSTEGLESWRFFGLTCWLPGALAGLVVFGLQSWFRTPGHPTAL